LGLSPDRGLPSGDIRTEEKCVPIRRKVGGCFTFGGKKDCKYEYKEVCE